MNLSGSPEEIRDFMAGVVNRELIAKAEAEGAEPLEGMAGMAIKMASPEQRYTLGLAYPAMKPDSNVAADGHIDFVNPETLEKTAWSWMRNYRDIGLFHKEGTSGHAEVVESYIYRGPDWTIPARRGGQTVIKAGDWLLGTIWDDYGWDLVKQGLVRGWSPEGGARRRIPDMHTLSQLRSE